MKLTQKTRKRLYQSKVAEFSWPESAPEPRRGHLYAVYNEKGHRAFQIRLESVSRSTETTVKARIVDDPHRPLYGINGTRNEWGDYESEPEQVPLSYQDRLDREARQKTALLGAHKRRDQRILRTEVKLAKAQANGHTKAEKTLERVRRAA